MNEFVPQETFAEVDDIFFKRYVLPEGSLVPQHAHAYDHATLLAEGRIMSWCGEVAEEFAAPALITIKANAKHKFFAIEDSVLYCIHNMRGKGEYKISEEHKLWHSA